jgi:hypothetical protein
MGTKKSTPHHFLTPSSVGCEVTNISQKSSILIGEQKLNVSEILMFHVHSSDGLRAAGCSSLLYTRSEIHHFVLVVKLIVVRDHSIFVIAEF